MDSLKEFLGRIDELDQSLVAYVPSGEETTASSTVTVLEYAGPQQPKPAGCRYLLEVHTIRDVLDTWSKWRDGRTPNAAERVEAVLFYAKYDGYLPVE